MFMTKILLSVIFSFLIVVVLAKMQDLELFGMKMNPTQIMLKKYKQDVLKLKVENKELRKKIRFYENEKAEEKKEQL